MRQSTCLSDDQFLGEEHSSNLPSNNLAFIVYWSSLVLLLQSIFYFALRKLLSTVLLQAFALVKELICGDGHISLWRSQPRSINCYEGNAVLAASIFRNCAPIELSKNNQRDKEWLDANSDSYMAL